MASFNKVLLMGNLTRDPELKYTPNGTPVTEFGLAMNRKYTSVQGEKKEDVCFVDITVFGRMAEVANEYLAKGRPLFVEGRLKFDTWETADGQRRSKLRVVAENFQFLGRRGEGEQKSQGPSGRVPVESEIDIRDMGGKPDKDDMPRDNIPF